jgi:hypothetical protein
MDVCSVVVNKKAPQIGEALSCYKYRYRQGRIASLIVRSVFYSALFSVQIIAFSLVALKIV